MAHLVWHDGTVFCGSCKRDLQCADCGSPVEWAIPTINLSPRQTRIVSRLLFAAATLIVMIALGGIIAIPLQWARFRLWTPLIFLGSLAAFGLARVVIGVSFGLEGKT